MSSETEQILCITLSRRTEFKTGGLPRLISEAGGVTELLQLQGTETVDRAAKELQVWKRSGIHVLPITDPLYPEHLRAMYEPPVLLFYRGRWDADAANVMKLAIVGSRKAGIAWCDLAKSMASQLASSGFCIVSGLAYGIDAAAHWGALESETQCPTIAVLGNGLSTIYPEGNRRLAEQIIERGGTVISQFEPAAKPYPSNFLNRNRIIAGLTKGVVVIAAGRRSGSLVTARYALEEGREVFVVPGAVTDSAFEGSNALIKQGAILTTSVEDVWEVFPGNRTAQGESRAALSPNLSVGQQQIVKYLRQNGPTYFDDMVSALGERSKITTDLFELVLGGVVIEAPGNIVQLAARG